MKATSPHPSNTIDVDVLIVGAGASGLMCAIEAGKRGRSVVLLDHAHKLGEKIRISGGGYCNFTNLTIKADNYLSRNPHFCRSALARYTPQHFIALLQKHGLSYCEKSPGQLFCDNGSDAIIKMLKDECDSNRVKLLLSCNIAKVQRSQTKKQAKSVFQVSTNRGDFLATSLVIATGGLSIPKIGATPLGYQIAEQFAVPMTDVHPGLVPLTFHPEEWVDFAELAGISADVAVNCDKQTFRENVLFTHRGLSGPAILQISSYWKHGQDIRIDLLPDLDIQQVFIEQRCHSRMMLDNFLAQFLPKRLAEIWIKQFAENKPLNQYSEKALSAIANQLHNWNIRPTGTLGYSKAEVTCGGVDTQALSSKTMQVNDEPGLYFIGEVVDVTGQLGGYNFQWAWSSGFAAGQVV